MTTIRSSICVAVAIARRKFGTRVPLYVNELAHTFRTNSVPLRNYNQLISDDKARRNCFSELRSGLTRHESIFSHRSSELKQILSINSGRLSHYLMKRLIMKIKSTLSAKMQNCRRAANRTTT